MLLGRYWNDGEAEWNGVAALRDWARALRNLALRAAGDRSPACSRAPRAMGTPRERGPRAARRVRLDRSRVRRVRSGTRRVQSSSDARRGAARPRRRERWGSPDAPDALGRVRSSVITWQGATRQLRDWCAWRRARAEAMRSNLAPLVRRDRARELPADQIRTVFERSYAQWWLAAVGGPGAGAQSVLLAGTRAQDPPVSRIRRSVHEADALGHPNATGRESSGDESPLLRNSEMGHPQARGREEAQAPSAFGNSCRRSRTSCRGLSRAC